MVRLGKVNVKKKSRKSRKSRKILFFFPLATFTARFVCPDMMVGGNLRPF